MKKVSLLILMLILSLPVFAETDPHYELASELYQQKNYLEAFRAFEVLAQRGDARAQTITALMYKFGEGVNQDLELAYQWYRRAAIQGYPPAQFHVGSMLAEGSGTEADPEQAIKWLNIALENGYDRAQEKLNELNESIFVADIPIDQLPGWKNQWDLRLPNDIRFQETNPIEPDSAYMAQVGAMNTQTAANKLWQVLVEYHPKLFELRQPTIQSVFSDDRHIYQIRTGPFANYNEVKSFCDKLLTSTRQAGCLPIKQP